MSEKIGLARVEIVDLLALILRTHSRDELFLLFRSAEGITPKADPEAWREEYRKKQAAGVRFENKGSKGGWYKGEWAFTEPKEDYREDRPTIPHLAERKLWLAQREAGTNEVWQALDGMIPHWIDVEGEPRWHPKGTYRVKPMKLTAKIRRPLNPKIIHKIQDWELFGTREEYRAECEKYGYAILSEIKEVVEKPKTVKYYFALGARYGVTIVRCDEDRERLIKRFKTSALTIIGDIESREVEV